MNEQLKRAYIKVTQKHTSAVQTDEALGRLDYDDERWYVLEKKSKQFWKDYEAADSEFRDLLKRCTLND